jgi:acyl-coenzyme A thioesterase PaaI-like protein
MSDDIAAPESAIPDGYVALDWRRGFGRQIGPLYRKLGPQGPLMGFRVEDYHTNGKHNAHGGMLMTFADMSWGQVVSYELSCFWVTIRLTCDFLSSARLGDWVEGTSEVLSRKDEVFVVRGRVWSGDRTLITGSGLFKPLEAREPRPGEKNYRETAVR